MNEAISLLKTSRPTFYRWLRSGKVKGMKVGRQWRFYRDDIERLVQAVTEGGRKTLVVFIDELDRCRPPYAIALLEHAKHLFAVPGIVFVVSVDREQLSNSICAVYGERFDADGYLRRFFDLDFALPDPPGKDFVHHLFETMGLFDLLGERKYPQLRHEEDELYKILGLLVPPLRLGLRTQIHIFSRIKIVIMTTSENHRIFPRELALLAVLREWKRTLYERFVSGEADPKEIIDLLAETSSGAIFKESPGWFLEGYILAMGAEVGRQSPLIQKYRDRLNEKSVDTFRSREQVSIEVFDGVRGPGGNGTHLRVTAARIVFSERFSNHES